MAATTLVPTLSVSINTSSEKITFTDTTGRYDATNNTGGWGSSTVEYDASVTVTLTSATIYVYDYNDTLLETFVVTTQLTALDSSVAPLTQEIVFTAEDWTHGDGVYKYEYQVVDNSNPTNLTAPFTKVPFLHRGNLLQCIDDQRFKYLQEADEKKRTKYKHRVDELMMIDVGLVNTFQVGNYTDANNGYSDASDLCAAYDNCEC
jgi:hypothetical protein